MRDLPSGTVTLLFADIEGSTRLLSELGDRYATLLADYRSAVRETIRQHEGVEVDTQGDAFFVAFARARDAVAAAHDTHRALAGSRVRARIGVHTGEPVLTSDGYVGLDVHRGARICATGHGGQTLISEATRRLIGDEFALRDLGEHRLKDLKEPEWLFQLLAPDLEPRFPPLRSLSNTNLPAETNPLIGRERELGELDALLRQDSVRLVTLTGPGGTGKTRLALRAAADAVERFANGVFLVALAPVSDPETVVGVIAQTVGAKQALGETPADSLRGHIEGKQLLLVLDNFEQVLKAATDVARLLGSAPRLKVIVTSRERLRVAGEHEYAVMPLPDDSAVRLFEARARAVKPSFRLDGEREAVTAICRRLDGLPLAVELAAARIKVLPPQALLLRLEQRLPLLKGGARDAPLRQQTLRGTIEWSYQLLDPHERLVFAGMGVFVGGCTLESAVAVCGADLETVTSLVEKSLLRYEKERFFMLETIREYAFEHLERSEDLERIMQRYAHHVAELATPLAGPARRSESAALDRLESEHFNGIAAFHWALARADQDLCERLLEGFCFNWLKRGHSAEGYRLAHAALTQARSPSPMFLTMTGELARFNGDLDRAVELMEQAVAAHKATALGRIRLTSGPDTPTNGLQTIPDPYVAMALTDLAKTLIQRGEFGRAESLANDALAIRMEIGEQWGIAHARRALIRLEFRRGNYRRTAELCEASIPIWQKLHSWSELAWEYVMATSAYLGIGDVARARRRLRDGLECALQCGDFAALAGGLEQAAALAANERADRLALTLLGAGRAWRRSAGVVAWQDESALSLVGGRVGDPLRKAWLSEGEAWPLLEAGVRALDYLRVEEITPSS